MHPVGRGLAPAGPDGTVPLTVRRADVGIGPYGWGLRRAGAHCAPLRGRFPFPYGFFPNLCLVPSGSTM